MKFIREMFVITYLFTEYVQHSTKRKATFRKGSTNIILDHSIIVFYTKYI